MVDNHEFIVHQALLLVANDRDSGIHDLLDFLVVHIVAFHHHPHHHPAFMGVDQSIPDTPQVETVCGHIHGKARLVQGSHQDLIRSALIVLGMHSSWVGKVDLDPVSRWCGCCPKPVGNGGNWNRWYQIVCA